MRIEQLYSTLFDDVVGQDSAKSKLNFYLKNHLRSHIIPNLILVGPKGNGKTLLAKKMASGLVKFDKSGNVELTEKGTPKRKKFYEINCSSIKSLPNFINGIVAQKIHDRDCTLLFDEASEIPHDVAMALLTILNPNKSQTSFSVDNFVYEFDFTRQSWLFATSEPQSIFHALLDRLRRIDLEDYNIEHLAQIIQKESSEIKYEGNLLQEMALVTRGNARNANMLACDIKTYLNDNKIFSKRDWEKLKSILDIKPLGLSPLEIRILKLLEQNPSGLSLTGLSARTGLTREALQRSLEIFLLKHGLMEIVPAKGRILTAKGIQYLHNL